MNPRKVDFSGMVDVLLLLTGPFLDGVIRFGVGLLITPFLYSLLHRPASFLDLISSLLAVLFSLRVIPAIIRRLIPFSLGIQKIWSDRRQIAKRHDSYQWQKMFWVGLGLLLYSISAHAFTSPAGMTGILLLLLGSIGLLRWSTLVSRPN